MYHEVNGYQSCNSGVPGTSQMNTKWESQEQRWMEAREDGTLPLCAAGLHLLFCVNAHASPSSGSSYITYINLMERDAFTPPGFCHLPEAYDVSVRETSLSPRSCFGRTPSELWQILCRSWLAECTPDPSLWLLATVLMTVSSQVSSGYRKADVLR